MRFFVLFALLTLSLSGFAQTREQAEVEMGVEPMELPDNTQEGDLNTNTQVNGNNTAGSYNTNKTYNGAGSSGMPVNTAISPSLMSNGSESCLQSTTGGLQLIGVGVSSGRYTQDIECNRRRDAITLSNMGMKVAAISTLCMDARVFDSMWMAGTPCPFMGKIGNEALLAWNKNVSLIPAKSEIRTLKEIEIAEETLAEKKAAVLAKKEIKAQEENNKIEAARLKEEKRLLVKEEKRQKKLELKQRKALADKRKERSADGDKKNKTWVFPLAALIWLL